MANVKKAILQKKIEGEVYDLLVKTSAEMVLMPDGETTLAAYLANLAVGGVTAEEMQGAIKVAIDAIVDGAPEAFDTLKELAEWVENHEDLYDGLVTNLAGKVDKVDGKGLSTEDFTSALKSKLESLSNYDDTAIKADIEAVKDAAGDKARILVATTTPADLTEKDLFIQVVE